MMSQRPLTPDQIVAYHRDGYLLVPGFFDAEEIAPMQEALRHDPSVGGRLATVHDGSEKTRHDYLGWTRHGDDWLGVATRLARCVEGAAALIGEPVYHWHSKLVKKPAGNSGRVVWHQDFSGWYQDGCLMPDMLTVIVALTPATLENGCLHMLRGSHRMGRLDRVRDADAYAAIQPRRLAAILDRFEDVPLTMAPGDGLFFHGNVVHASFENTSRDDRMLLEFSYNGVSNAPVFDNQDHHAVKPMTIMPDDSLRQGAWNGVFGSTPLCDIDDPRDEGYSIFHREGVADLN